MMWKAWRAAVMAGLVLGASGAARADSQLVMFSANDCLSCRAFYHEVLPSYWGSEESLDLPIRIVDVQALGSDGNALNAPLTEMPTFVFMQDGREIARLEGYEDRDAFYAQIETWRRLAQ